jgi:hypothetical protein
MSENIDNITYDEIADLHKLFTNSLAHGIAKGQPDDKIKSYRIVLTGLEALKELKDERNWYEEMNNITKDWNDSKW